MALESIVFKQDSFSYGHKDDLDINDAIWKNSSNSSSDFSGSDGCFIPGGSLSAVAPPVVMAGKGKRRYTKRQKNNEEMENQRMTHIAVERNRRRQMNDYLALLRSLMPTSYSQRGDQASIVGGAINFLKELEQLLQFLESHKQVNQQYFSTMNTHSKLFNHFFTFPQFSTCPNPKNFEVNNSISSSDEDAIIVDQKHSTKADIEVTKAEGHANIKILTRRRYKQLLTMVTLFHSLNLTILHLNVTTSDHLVLYTFNVKIEDYCKLTTVNDIATAVHEMLDMLVEEPFVVA